MPSIPSIRSLTLVVASSLVACASTTSSTHAETASSSTVASSSSPVPSSSGSESSAEPTVAASASPAPSVEAPSSPPHVAADGPPLVLHIAAATASFPSNWEIVESAPNGDGSIIGRDRSDASPTCHCAPTGLLMRLRGPRVSDPVLVYAGLRAAMPPMDIREVIAPGQHGLAHRNAIGHIATAQGEHGPEVIWIVVAVHGGIAYQLLLEFPADMADRLMPEAERILGSLQFENPRGAPRRTR